MNGKILVVGGYGKVGRVVCTALSGKFPGRVVAAGRDFGKAERFSVETRRRALPLELDVCSTQAYACLNSEVKLVVMCIDQCGTEFIRECLRRGIHYIDISASFELFSKIELLDDESKQHGATAVLSVGLAPGLTNLLASLSKSHFDEMRHVDIFVMLGLGEDHGEAAIRWTVENLNSEFYVHDCGGMRAVRCFEDGKGTIFPGSIGRRLAFRFSFPDQLVLPKTLGVDSAATWLCFDSAPLSRFFALCKKSGLFNILRFRSQRDLMVGLFKTIHFGSDRFSVAVEAQGTAKGRYVRHECAISGNGEGRITGLVAAEVAERLCTTSYPAGVFHIEQLFEPLGFIEKLERHGLEFFRILRQPLHCG